MKQPVASCCGDLLQRLPISDSHRGAFHRDETPTPEVTQRPRDRFACRADEFTDLFMSQRHDDLRERVPGASRPSQPLGTKGNLVQHGVEFVCAKGWTAGTVLSAMYQRTATSNDFLRDTRKRRCILNLPTSSAGAAASTRY